MPTSTLHHDGAGRCLFGEFLDRANKGRNQFDGEVVASAAFELDRRDSEVVDVDVNPEIGQFAPHDGKCRVAVEAVRRGTGAPPRMASGAAGLSRSATLR